MAKTIEYQELTSITRHNDGHVNIIFARHSTSSETKSSHDFDEDNKSRESV
jgi:hypothetical protein